MHNKDREKNQTTETGLEIEQELRRYYQQPQAPQAMAAEL